MGYKYPTPQLLFKAICNAIRSKTGNSDEIPHQNIPDELDSILTEEECEIAALELSNIIYGSREKVLNSIYIPYIASYKFYGSDLTTVNLPECTSIGTSTFMNCTNLTTVNLPKCATIGDTAFMKCTNLTTVIFGADRVVTLMSSHAFNNSAISRRTGYIYVPDNLVDSYKTATNWSTYANQIKPLSKLPSNLKEEYGYD